MNVTKTNVKSLVKEQFQCPWDFVEQLNAIGVIDELKQAINEGEKDIDSGTRDRILGEYKTYCNTWGLDVNADNRNYHR